MSYGRGKNDNSYARRVFDIDAPKTVWMAIAFSLAMRIREDDFALAAQEVYAEWEALHANGIVPQKPRRTKP
jgi:hypothetical protein